MRIDQAEQPLVKHLVQRSAVAEQSSLLRRNTEAEQQRRRSHEQTHDVRVEQAMQAIQCLHALGRLDTGGQQHGQIDACKPCHEMHEADEAAHHAVAIKAVGEIGMPRAADDVALVPIGPRLIVKDGP